MFDWFLLQLHLRINWLSVKIGFERDVEVYSDDEDNQYDNFKLILYVFIIYYLSPDLSPAQDRKSR